MYYKVLYGVPSCCLCEWDMLKEHDTRVVVGSLEGQVSLSFTASSCHGQGSHKSLKFTRGHTQIWVINLVVFGC